MPLSFCNQDLLNSSSPVAAALRKEALQSNSKAKAEHGDSSSIRGRSLEVEIEWALEEANAVFLADGGLETEKQRTRRLALERIKTNEHTSDMQGKSI